MSETAGRQPNPEPAAQLQSALDALLGTFEGQTPARPSEIDPTSIAGLGQTMVDGVARSTAEAGPPTRTIEEDIAMGTSPWLAHLRHNRRDECRPLTIGFYQDEAGKIRPLYGIGLFESKRRITAGILQYHTTERRVAMLAGEFVPVQSPTVIQGEHWDVLPPDLREHFERGEILVTTNNDLYANWASPPTTEQLASQEDTYFLMYYYDVYHGGRTGVVMHIVDGELQPVTATVDDREYILEVKGCGMRHGGFGGAHDRTGREIVTGGAEAEQTVIELERLADERQPGAPKAVGGILFENPDVQTYGYPDGQYPQGYTIRLSPSTLRASYMGHPNDSETVYPNVQTPEMVERVLDMYTAHFAEHMFGNPPKILNRSYHTENILVWGAGEYTFTDYSDHATFADSHYPNDRIDPKEMLLCYFEMVNEMPGMRRELRPGFYARLNQQFAQRGITIVLNSDDTFEAATQKIWEGCMAYQVYKARVGSNYAPDALIEDHFKLFDAGMVASIDRSSADAMAASTDTARAKLLQAIDTIAVQGVATPSWPDRASLKAAVSTAKFSELATIADNLRKDYVSGSNHIPDDESRDVREAMAFWGAFKTLTLYTAQEYFKHEFDVLDNALLNCPDSEREAIVATRDELLQKRDYLLSLPDTNVRALHAIVKDAASMRAFLQPSAYRAVA